jgi:hypothetical protein
VCAAPPCMAAAHIRDTQTKNKDYAWRKDSAL